MHRQGVLSTAAWLVRLSPPTWLLALLIVSVYVLAALSITSDIHYPGVIRSQLRVVPVTGVFRQPGLSAQPCRLEASAALYFLHSASSLWLILGLLAIMAAYLVEGEAARSKLGYLVAVLGRHTALRAYAVYSLIEALLIFLPISIGIGALAYLYGGVSASDALGIALYLESVTSIAMALYWVILALMGTRRYFTVSMLAYLLVLVLEMYGADFLEVFDPMAALSAAIGGGSLHVLIYPLALYASGIAVLIAIGERA